MHERHPRLPLLLALCVAQLMVILDISAVNVALPDLGRDLRIAPEHLGWAITSYSLMFGSLLLLGGRAADLLGRRRVFLTGLGVFTAASLLTALAGDPAMLFAARAGQGLGAALLSPAALSILTVSFTGTERAKALAVWGAVGGAGAAIGVLLGGVLTELVGWRAIFFVNLPVGLALAVAALHLLPADEARPHWRGLDVRGALVATASLGVLVYAISERTIGLGVAALAGLAVFALLELRTRRPLLRIQRLADRAVGGGFVMMLAASSVLFGSFLLTSLHLQEELGMGALRTGLAFLPFALATGIGVHAAQRVGNVRVPLAAGFVIAAAGMLVLSGGGPYLTHVLPGMVVAGVGLGLVLVSVSVSVLAGAADDEAGMLAGLNTTGHEIGGSLGIAILVTVAAANGIGTAFLVAAGIAAVAGVAALFVLPSIDLAHAPRVAFH